MLCLLDDELLLSKSTFLDPTLSSSNLDKAPLFKTKVDNRYYPSATYIPQKSGPTL